MYVLKLSKSMEISYCDTAFQILFRLTWQHHLPCENDVHHLHLHHIKMINNVLAGRKWHHVQWQMHNHHHQQQQLQALDTIALIPSSSNIMSYCHWHLLCMKNNPKQSVNVVKWEITIIALQQPTLPPLSLRIDPKWSTFSWSFIHFLKTFIIVIIIIHHHDTSI